MCFAVVEVVNVRAAPMFWGDLFWKYELDVFP